MRSFLTKILKGSTYQFVLIGAPVALGKFVVHRSEFESTW